MQLLESDVSLGTKGFYFQEHEIRNLSQIVLWVGPFRKNIQKRRCGQNKKRVTALPNPVAWRNNPNRNQNKPTKNKHSLLSENIQKHEVQAEH